MADDLEDYWARLGRPGKVARASKALSQRSQTFLGFLFGWIGLGWKAFWAKSWQLLGLACILAAGAYVVWVVKQDGKVNYCRTAVSVQNADGRYGVDIIGHRTFRDDVVLIRNVKSEDLQAWADTFHCEYH